MIWPIRVHDRSITIVLLCALFVSLALGVPARAQVGAVHIVQEGENLFRLALRYGTTVEELVSLNKLTDSNSLQVGQRLNIPSSDTVSISAGPAMTTGGTYIVQRGDTLNGIALRYKISVWELVHANSLRGPNIIFVGQKLTIPGAGGTTSQPIVLETSDTYVVRAGDTLSALALRFGTTAFALASSNGISDPSSIRVGQRLRVPRSASNYPSSPGGSKSILVNLTEQHLYAFAGEYLVYSFICSSGVAPYYTRTGTFQVQSKIPNAYGGAWDIWMPHWLGIYWAGGSENGIHALPIMQSGQVLWGGYLGSPVSYGCIVLDTYDAELLYNWADIGTPVVIRY